MTRERRSRAESKNCEILLLLTADRRFDTKVKCPTGRASFWVKFPAVRSLTRVKCPGIARGGGWAIFGIDWYINIPYTLIPIAQISSFSNSISRLFHFHRNIPYTINFPLSIPQPGNFLPKYSVRRKPLITRLPNALNFLNVVI